MQKAGNLPGKGWWNVVFPLTALLVLAADQLSKVWIRTNLAIGESLFELGFFRFTHIRNTGAAFGLFRDYSFFLTVVALIGIVAILVYALFINRHFPILDTVLGRSALGLVLGGTVGNLIDRLYFGSVTDFIDFGIWPAFNVADSAIVVGIIILAYSLLRLSRVEKHSDG